MARPTVACPRCGSSASAFEDGGNQHCQACGHQWHWQAARLFLSYGRRDAQELANRLKQDLEAYRYSVWLDTQQLQAGGDWQQGIKDGLRSTQIVVAVLSPHAVRATGHADNPDDLDSVCLDEISFARFAQPPTPIVPVMAIPCEPPFCIFRLDYVDLCAWRNSEDQYQAGLKRLLAAIEAGLRGDVRYRSWVHHLKPWDFAAFLNEKRQYFCGRQWIFDAIDAWRSASHERALLIKGDPGTGKSALVAELVHRNPDGQVLAYHCCQADTPATLQPGLFVRSLAAMIASKLEGYEAMLVEARVEEALSEDSCARDPGSAMELGILAPLESLPAPADGPRYILIDALDEALLLDGGPARGPTIVDILASRLERMPAWLRIVATTRREPAVLDRLRGLRAEELNAQDPRNLDDIEQYIALRLRTPDLMGRLQASGRPADHVRQLLRAKSEGNFLYVKQALQGIQRDLYDFDRLDALPPGLYGLYLGFFRRHFPDEASYAPARRVLEVVVAAQEPLTGAQVAGATGLDAEEELPRVLRRLSVYLPEREGCYSVYHKSLADWLTDPELRGQLHYVSRRRGHERLADYCWAEYKGASEPSAFVLRHLPTHLSTVGRWEDVDAVLRDVRFIEAKSAAGMMFELLTDFQALLTHHRERGDVAGMLAVASALRRGAGDIPLADQESYLIWLGAVLAAEGNGVAINRTVSFIERQPRGPDRLRMIAEFLIGMGRHPHGMGRHPGADRLRERFRSELQDAARVPQADGLDVLAAEALGDPDRAFALAARDGAPDGRRLCRALKLVRRQPHDPRAPELLAELLDQALAGKLPSEAADAIGAACGLLAPSEAARRLQEQAVGFGCREYGARSGAAEAAHLATYLADQPALLFSVLDRLGAAEPEPEGLTRALLFLEWFNQSLPSDGLIGAASTTRAAGRRPLPDLPAGRSGILQAHLQQLEPVHARAARPRVHEGMRVPIYALWARLAGAPAGVPGLASASLQDIRHLSLTCEAAFPRAEPLHTDWVELGQSLCCAGNTALAGRLLRHFEELVGSSKASASTRAFFTGSLAAIDRWLPALLVTAGVTGVIQALWWILLALANVAALPWQAPVYWNRLRGRPAPPLLIRQLDRRKARGQGLPWWLTWPSRRLWQLAAVGLLDVGRADLAQVLVAARAPEEFFRDWRPGIWSTPGRAAALERLFADALSSSADPDRAHWLALLRGLAASGGAEQHPSLPVGGLRLVAVGRLRLSQLLHLARRARPGRSIAALSQAEAEALANCIASIAENQELIDALHTTGDLVLADPGQFVASLLQSCMSRPIDTFAEVLHAITAWPGMQGKEVQSQMRKEYAAIVRKRYAWPSWYDHRLRFGALRFLYRKLLVFRPGGRTETADFLWSVHQDIYARLTRW